MKTHAMLAGLTALGLCGSASAASIVVDAGNGADLVLTVSGGTFDSEEVPPSGSANVYASNDGGSTLLNGGGSNASLAWSQAITDGLVITLITNDFGLGNHTGVFGFDVLGADGSTLIYDGAVDAGNVNTGGAEVLDGASVVIVDTDGVQWNVAFNALGPTGSDIIGGVDSIADGTNDLASSLTFTIVPEPGSLALLGLGGLSILRRRR